MYVPVSGGVNSERRIAHIVVCACYQKGSIYSPSTPPLLTGVISTREVSYMLAYERATYPRTAPTMCARTDVTEKQLNAKLQRA